jgi:cobalt-zinc-cadmium resistance protein CzcA
MMTSIIDFAVQRRWQVMVFTLLIAALGFYSAVKLPIDAVPDITNVQVQINSEADGYTPLEVEQRITYVLENAMAGIPNMQMTRSLSRYGLSQITIVFNEGTDIYWARQQIIERLQGLPLPKGIEPMLGPVASGLGEIYTYAVRAEKGATKEDGSPYTAEDLRTLQDWVIMRVKGVTEINSIGGFERQYQIAPDPAKLLAFKVTMKELIDAISANNQNMGAGFTERFGEQWLMRSNGQLKDLNDIGEVVVTKRDDAPVMVKDLADVLYGKELRTGAATLNGEEAVLGTAMMLIGENSREVSKAVAEALVQVNKSLPEGVVAEALYDRTTLVDKTIKTVQTNLFEGAVLVIVVLFLLLGHFRAALIAALVIPLSMLFAMTGMAAGRVSGNLMSLGAIDFGLIVDGAVIVVENAIRRLADAQKRLGRVQTLSERLEEVKGSTLEVFKPAVFGLLVIMLVYVPIFALEGVEGKMFHPMAFTVIAALIGAMIFSVTFVPAAIAIFVTGKVSEHQSRWMQKLSSSYESTLKFCLETPAFLLAIALVLVVGSGLQMLRMGSEFLPKLDEHDVALHALRIPGTSLTQSVDMQKFLDSELKSLPEVANVFSKIGTPEVATDPMPPNVADTFLILKPRDEWPDPSLSKATFIDKVRDLIQRIPGNNYEITQPIEMRFNELIAGVRSDVAIRLYGDDLDVLRETGEKIEGVLSKVTGAVDVRMEQATGLPVITLTPKRDHLGLLGLSVDDVQQSLREAVSGAVVGTIYEGDKRFKLIVRLPQQHIDNDKALANLPVFLGHVEDAELPYVPLGEVAEIEATEGPNQINRQNAKRNVVITANVEGMDLGSFIENVKAQLDAADIIPAGYWVEYGGTFEQLQSAKQRLSWVIPITLLLILGLLISAFNSIRYGLIIFTGIPLALTGGVFALALRGMPFSISAAVGFIALSGIAVLNGVVMLSFIRDLIEKGLSAHEAVLTGAKDRLRPVLMTALVASLGFLPMAMNTGAGAEVQRPLATVVIGGILSSTLLTLFILPLLTRWVHRKD